MLLAVLVLYKEKLEESKTFTSLFNTSPTWDERVHLLVYDNSPVPMHAQGAFDDSGGHIHYLSDTSNPGVSRAYNVGARIAKQLQKHYLLLLDQDTLFPPNALSRYFNAIESYNDSPVVAPMLFCDGRIYSPCRQVLHLHLPLRAIEPGTVSARGKSLLNSGMCIRLDAFDKAGGFDEKIPLDFADHDFMKRYRTHFDSFFLLDMACAHGFSDKENLDAGKALTRFGYYCQGARHSIKGVTDAFSLAPVAFLRAARLSARFRTLRFLRLLFRTLLRN
jgi:rhamnosyltransferase